MEPAPPWKRLAAAAVDVALCTGGFVILGVFLQILLEIAGLRVGGGGAPGGMKPLWFLFFFIYHAGLESSPGRGTLGKLALGVEVTTLSGERLTFGRAALRFLAKVVSLAAFGLGFLPVFFTARRQAFHDLVTGTVVTQREDSL